jgi:histidinol phosphatase-like enzyme
MTKWYMAKIVTVNYLRFEADSKVEARKRAEKMLKKIEKNVPADHKREFMVTDVYEEE